MVFQIRKICDDAFNNLPDFGRIFSFSSPKLIRVVEILLQYKPDHVGSSNHSFPNLPAQEDGGKSKKRPSWKYSSYDDPNALHCLIFVRDRFQAKTFYHFLKDLSRCQDRFSFISPQYYSSIDENDSSPETLPQVQCTVCSTENMFLRLQPFFAILYRNVASRKRLSENSGCVSATCWSQILHLRLESRR